MDEWYEMADFLEGTLALNGYGLTAEDYDRFVQERDGHKPWSRLFRAREDAFQGRTTHNKFLVLEEKDVDNMHHHRGDTSDAKHQIKGTPIPLQLLEGFGTEEAHCSRASARVER